MDIVDNRVDSPCFPESLGHDRVLEFLDALDDSSQKDDKQDEEDEDTDPEWDFVLEGKLIGGIFNQGLEFEQDGEKQFEKVFNEKSEGEREGHKCDQSILQLLPFLPLGAEHFLEYQEEHQEQGHNGKLDKTHSHGESNIENRGLESISRVRDQVIIEFGQKLKS